MSQEIRIRIGNPNPDPDWKSGSGSGTRQAKNVLKKRKKIKDKIFFVTKNLDLDSNPYGIRIRQ